ncbi:rab-GTPase-TBC domain-containing protein [Baffinella frigidus]|nr:rab-GTPase-TBC domain-containing protein [Cryptophyta sp. CCMP2293]
MRARDKHQTPPMGALAGAGKPEEELEAQCRAAILEAQQGGKGGMQGEGGGMEEQERPVSEKLTQIVRQKGWPPRFRPLLWAWSGTARRRAAEAHGRTYAAMVSHRRPPDASTCLAEIERDLGRTLPGQRGPDGEEDFFGAGAGRDRLRNVLAAYASFNPTVGYCQSMNFVAAVLLLQLRDEEAAFWVLVTLVEDVLPGYYHRSLAGLRVDQMLLESLVETEIPELAEKMRSLSLDLTFVSTNWLLCIFINSLPWDCVLRLFDILLQDGASDVLLRTAVGLLKLLQPKILACPSQEDLLGALKPKDGPLTLLRGKRIDPGTLMRVTFTQVRPLKDLAARREELAAAQRAKMRYSEKSDILTSPFPVCGL